jgi:hypothetical protein
LISTKSARDRTSHTFGSDVAPIKENGEMHLMGFSSDADSGYYPGDKVTVTVSKYVPIPRPDGLQDPYGVPQPVIDKKTIKLGETGGIVSLDLTP